METKRRYRSSLNFRDPVLQNDLCSDTSTILLPIKLIHLISLAQTIEGQQN